MYILYIFYIHRASFRIRQQMIAFNVPVVNVERSYVVAGLVNQARRLCRSFLSESTLTSSSFSLDNGGGGGRKELLLLRLGCIGGLECGGLVV